MKNIKAYFNQFHPLVWVLITGTAFIRGSTYMTLPFLSIYLSNLNMSPMLIGLTIGISPLMGTIGGFIGGQFSDRFGRIPMILISITILVFVFIGFSMTGKPILFLLLNALVGLSNSFFEPTSQALIADLTERRIRMKAFSLRYTAINIGASVGPLIGGYLVNVSLPGAFLFTGGIYLIYGVALFLFFSDTNKTSNLKV
ncbi:TPA: MFS transporter [Bacillus cereus]|nr:MFS transporter [Bacillus cereus]